MGQSTLVVREVKDFVAGLLSFTGEGGSKVGGVREMYYKSSNIPNPAFLYRVAEVPGDYPEDLLFQVLIVAHSPLTLTYSPEASVPAILTTLRLPADIVRVTDLIVDYLRSKGRNGEWLRHFIQWLNVSYPATKEEYERVLREVLPV